MKRPSEVLSALATILGYAFVILGGAKLNQVGWAVDGMLALGIGPKGVALVGWGEIIIGAILAHGPLQKLGARILLGWIVVALFVHLKAGDDRRQDVHLGIVRNRCGNSQPCRSGNRSGQRDRDDHGHH
jgi:uncharacterized membrane protein YphA (DoxX/SURF4 family)